MSPSAGAADSVTAAAMTRALDWFTSLGWTPFDFQRQTWDAYLRGESGLLHAPTGVGKTLAVWMGPVLDWMARNDTSTSPRKKTAPAKPETFARRRARCAPLEVLWITPLRALAYDTTEALLTPVEGLGLPWSVEMRTGDTSATLRARQRERLPTALVTTPESLSIQLSYPDARERLATLRCVIVDEWHELLGTKRGVQTELALARLRRWNPGLRVWGLSATIGNLEQAMQVLMGGAALRPTLISSSQPKAVVIDTLIPDQIDRFPWAGHLGTKLLQPVIEKIESAGATLLFTNTRSQAEIWFQSILRERPDWIGQVALHHGSLERKLREKVEKMLAAGLLRAVVCTSSLDLGVDFTPVDQVLQVGSPKGVGRLMQRAGRSGHQPGATSRIVGVPTHTFELVEFAAARDALAARQIEARIPLERPLDVLVQHAVTIALGGGFEREDLLAEVRKSHAYRNLSDDEWNWVLDFVTRGGEALRAYPQYARVQVENQLHVVKSRQMALRHRLAIGTISSDPAVNVRLISGGRLGSVEESFVSRLKPGDCFVFAGRLLEFVRFREMTVFARKAREVKGIVPRWNGARFPLSTQLGAAVRRKLSTALDGAALEPEMQSALPLIKMQARISRIPAPDELLIETTQTDAGWHLYLYPFEGRLVHDGLAVLLAYRLTKREPASIGATANDYGIELLSPAPIQLDETSWRELFSTDNLVHDLLNCLNATQLARRQFRDIARIAGLVFPGYPGLAPAQRHLQASSELIFDVFCEFDPNNRLLDQARREVLDDQLEIVRMRHAMERIAAMKFVMVTTDRLTPLAFQLWAESLRSNYLSSERWATRVKRMAELLERDPVHVTVGEELVKPRKSRMTKPRGVHMRVPRKPVY